MRIQQWTHIKHHPIERRNHARELIRRVGGRWVGYASAEQNKLSYFTVQILRLLLWRETGGFEFARLISSRKSFYPEELLSRLVGWGGGCVLR